MWKWNCQTMTRRVVDKLDDEEEREEFILGEKKNLLCGIINVYQPTSLTLLSTSPSSEKQQQQPLTRAWESISCEIVFVINDGKMWKISRFTKNIFRCIILTSRCHWFGTEWIIATVIQRSGSDCIDRCSELYRVKRMALLLATSPH